MDTLPYQILGDDAPSTSYRMIRVTGNNQDGFIMDVEAGNEAVYSDPYITLGTFAKFEVGIMVAGEMEWITYHDACVLYYDFNIADGTRSAQITILPDAIWHTQVLTHAYYMEMQGREVEPDAATDLSNLYPVDGVIDNTVLSVDLWSDDYVNSNPNGLVAQQNTPGQSQSFYSSDIAELCAYYPVFGTDPTYDIYIYGWSRSGANNGTSSDAIAGGYNDTVRACIVIQDLQGQQQHITTNDRAIGFCICKLSAQWHSLVYQSSRDGSYPIIYRIPNPGPGKQIIRLGIQFNAPNDIGSGGTTFYPERIVMPEIIMEPNLSNLWSADGWTAPTPASTTDWQLGLPIADGEIDITSESGTLISGLQPGQPYAIESTGGPWWFDDVPTGGPSRRFVVSNDTGTNGLATPPWYGGNYADSGNMPQAMQAPYWSSKVTPLDNPDQPEGNRNYRVYFTAVTDHVYIKAACDPHTNCHLPEGVSSWGWLLSHATPPAPATPATVLSEGAGSPIFGLNIELVFPAFNFPGMPGFDDTTGNPNIYIDHFIPGAIITQMDDNCVRVEYDYPFEFDAVGDIFLANIYDRLMRRVSKVGDNDPIYYTIKEFTIDYTFDPKTFYGLIMAGGFLGANGIQLLNVGGYIFGTGVAGYPGYDGTEQEPQLPLTGTITIPAGSFVQSAFNVEGTPAPDYLTFQLGAFDVDWYFTGSIPPPSPTFSNLHMVFYLSTYKILAWPPEPVAVDPSLNFAFGGWKGFSFAPLGPGDISTGWGTSTAGGIGPSLADLIQNLTIIKKGLPELLFSSTPYYRGTLM